MEFRRYAATLSAFATVLYAALLVAALGVLSVLLQRDVIDDADAGPLAGPVACAIATAVVFAGLLVRALHVPPYRRSRREERAGASLPAPIESAERLRHEHRRDIALGVALLLGIGSYLGYAVGGGAVIAIADPYRFGPFVVQQLIGPFAAVAGILSVVVVLLDMIVLASRADQRGRPRWPWENHD